jgi:hypothetical protein
MRTGGDKMKRKILLPLILSAFIFNTLSFAQDKAVVHDVKAKNMLLGRHLFSLQWISWDRFGAATVTDQSGVFRLKGEQRKGRDFVKIDGVITSIDATEFKFDGTITTQISQIAGGAPCERTGEMTFAITGKRKYWRLQEMQNPCDDVVDYVDIYFR